MRDVLATPLNLIYEASIANSDLPQDLKDAYISAILKKGNKRNPNNYRSVSLTCIACKILESIIRDHIIQYMKQTFHQVTIWLHKWKIDIVGFTLNGEM